MKHLDLLKKAGFTLGVLLVFILGQQLAVPGVGPGGTHALTDSTLLRLYSLTTGGQVARPTLLSLGLGPFMLAMLSWQAFAAMDLPFVSRWSDRRRGRIQRGLTTLFALLQALVTAFYLRFDLVPTRLFGVNVSLPLVVLLLVAGGLVVAALATANIGHGLGGALILIVPNLILSLPQEFRAGFGRSLQAWSWPLFAAAVVLGLVVVLVSLRFNRAVLHLPVERATLLSTYGESDLTLPALPAGVLPYLFAAALLATPREIVLVFHQANSPVGSFIVNQLTFTRWSGIALYALLIIGLTYLLGLISVAPDRLARGLQESGDYLLNVFPGADTEKLLMQRFKQLNFVATGWLLLVMVLPLVVGMLWAPAANLSLVFTNLALLIAVFTKVAEQIVALWRRRDYRLFTE